MNSTVTINTEQNTVQDYIIPIDRLILQLDLNHMQSILVGIKTIKGLQLYKVSITTYSMSSTRIVVTKMINRFRESNNKKNYDKYEFRKIFSQYELIDMRVIDKYKNKNRGEKAV